MAFDIVEQLRSLTYMDDAAAACQQAADEIVRLRRWKSEATAVIERWEAAWEAAGSPGQLGDAKSDALRDEIVRLRAVLDAIDALHTPRWRNPLSGKPTWCRECEAMWPCPTHLLIHPKEKP